MNHNATTTTTTAVFPPFTSTPSPATSSSSPISSKLGAGLGAALGFAAVVILLVLWHVFKEQRQRRQQRWLEEEYAASREGRGDRDSQHQDSTGVQSLSTPCGENGKRNEMVVTTTLLTLENEEPEVEVRNVSPNSQAEVNSPRRGRGRGREARPLGGSQWERRDGHGQTDSSSTQTNMAPAAADRLKFSFEGVAQSEDSIERLSQQRIAKPADGANRDGKDVDHDPEKGERIRHVYEMEPY